jgi:tryprostatin B 6-hydroxylase
LSYTKKYGPFVRVGSSDLMNVHPQGVPVVHNAQSKCRKGTWYDEDFPQQSIHTSRGHRFHQQRRRAWSSAFSNKALRGYERRVSGYNKALVQFFAQRAGETVNAAQWFNFYSFDVMGDLSFDQDFGCLKRGTQHWAVELLDEALNVQSMKRPTWVFRMMIAIPGLTDNYWKFIKYCDEQLEIKIAADRAGKSASANPMSVLLNEVGPKPTAQDMLNLQADARTIIVAGSDTTAATLTHIFYELARHPEHVRLFRKELGSLSKGNGSFENQDIQYASHLNAVIHETLRLYPVPPTTLIRITPPEGIVVDNQFIPGNMNVFTPQYALGRCEIGYERPLEFIPERWSTKPELIKDKSGYAPFSTGKFKRIILTILNFAKPHDLVET